MGAVDFEKGKGDPEKLSSMGSACQDVCGYEGRGRQLPDHVSSAWLWGTQQPLGGADSVVRDRECN